MSRLRGISKLEFAKRDGCDEKLVRVGVKQGRLVAFDDGSLDPALVGTPWRKRQEPKPRREKSADAPHSDIDYAEALRRKEVYLAKLRELEFDVKSGRLVEADAVAKAQFEIARRVHDQWMAWPNRIGPEIAAELGADHVQAVLVLERYVRKHLDEIASAELQRAGVDGGGPGVGEGPDAGAAADCEPVGGSEPLPEPEGEL